MQKSKKNPTNFFLMLYFIGVIILGGCDQEVTPLYCENGFISNNEQTECICPEPEYFLFDRLKGDGTVRYTSCVKREGFKFRLKFEGKNCIHRYFEHYNKEGIAEFSYNLVKGTGGIEIDMGAPFGDIGGTGNTGFQNVRVAERTDGGIDVSFLFVPWGVTTECHDWSTRTGCYYSLGRATGFSTPDRKRFEIKIDWHDECNNTYLDSGMMYMY